jgi:glycolate oxidase iron-sulfur subunit
MQTKFSALQLADPDVAEAEGILRACVHCGFCTNTCPTYVLLGNELDSPRGRIYLIKDMLENGRPATADVVKHIDRCLSCLSCMTTCPSGVNYMHLVDHARSHIEKTYRRPLADRLLRRLLALLIPSPRRFRLALMASLPFRSLASWLPGRLGAMLRMAPAHLPKPSPMDRPQVFPAAKVRRKRVALMTGCAQQVLDPAINEATIRLLTRHGVEVVVAAGAGCCGALVHHMGHDEAARTSARANIDSWIGECEREGLDAVIINTSGCGTTVKDYGFLLKHDPAYEAKAARVAGMTRDISEFMMEIGLDPPHAPSGLKVAYHAACSLQHGQQVRSQPKALLAAAGFAVQEIAESHICCGSAGTYNLLQPEIAGQLRDRKVAHIERTAPDLVAAGNLGCMTQIASGTRLPVVHTVELLDWATGGPKPHALGT